MAINFSGDQLKVIDTRNKNLCVAAAAGSGKTTVLVERIIRKITDAANPVDIDKILVVTFTNAAASDMKEKIRDALEAKLAANPSDERLQRQATLIHGAHITTIDSFCLDLVKGHFHSIDLDPAFRIASEGETALIKDEVLQKVIKRAYEEKDPDFLHMIDCYSKKDRDTAVIDSIMSLYANAMSYPWPEKWLNDRKGEYFYSDEEEYLQSGLIKKIVSNIKARIDRCLYMNEKALEISGLSDGPDKYIPLLTEESEKLQELHDLCETGNYLKIGEALLSMEFKRIPTVKSGTCDDYLKDTAKGYRDSYKSEFQSISKDYYSNSVSKEIENLRMAGRVVDAMVNLVLQFKADFDLAKRDRGIIDFSDMEHMAVRILIKDYEDMNHYTVTDIAKEYQKTFNEVMIDEYQDSNLVQEIILAAVSHQGTDMYPNRFMVGDVKQSIYRFRLARPEIFVAKGEDYSSSQDSVVVHLKENYRSRKEVVDSVNAVFEDIMCPELGGTVYSSDERLYQKASFENEGDPKSGISDNTTEVILTDTTGLKGNAARTEEYKNLAKLIKGIVGKDYVYDKNTKALRPARYGDIALLFRSFNGNGAGLREVLSTYKIPFYMENSGTFYEAVEIQDIINFLKVVDNPLDDVALYGSMTSFFGKMTDEHIASIKIAASKDEYYLWDKLTDYVSRFPEDSKAVTFRNLLELYRDKVIYTPIRDLITELVTDSGYLLWASTLPDGTQREANIELLIKKASDFAKTSFSGLFHFIRYIKLLEKSKTEEGEASLSDEKADIVRIMSIHKSKGLEFPITIICDIDKKLNTTDEKKSFLLDIDEGIGIMYIDPKRRIKRNTIIRTFIRNKISMEQLGEEIRILYVAMTRAKEHLILLGKTSKAEEYFSKGQGVKTGSYLALIRGPVANHLDTFFKVSAIGRLTEIAGEVKSSLEKEAARRELSGEALNPEMVTRIKDELSFDYRYKYLSGLFTKTSVSELKMAAMEEVQGETEKLFKEREKKEYIPKFAGRETTVSATERGNAYHKYLELVDFREKPDIEKWIADKEKFVREGYAEDAELSLVPVNKLKIFSESELAFRMHKAAINGLLFKEQPFVLGISAKRLDDKLPENETVLVQGIIDVYFEEDGKLVLMDYKTDLVSSEEELVTRYKVQLDIYKEALMQITGKEVGSVLIYSFGLNKTIVVK